ALRVFLRVSFFNYISFPDHETMERIVHVHFPDIKKELLRQALERFFDLREGPGLKKKPSTSELLDWLKLLVAEDISPEALHSQDAHKIVPPLHGALIKNEQDVHLFERLVFMSRRKTWAASWISGASTSKKRPAGRFCFGSRLAHQRRWP